MIKQNSYKQGATSKLQNFDDLQKIYSYGFRGEALNSLNYISDLTIITCQNNDEKDQLNGWEIKIDPFDKSISKKEVYHKKGTTILLQNIFSRIPVRLEDLRKNIKQQFSSIVYLVTEYSLIWLNVRTTLKNIDKLKNVQKIINSGLNSTWIEKIQNVLGYKYLEALEKFHFIHNQDSVKFEIEGFILKSIASGSVHISQWLKKNQFYVYVNARPINTHKKFNTIFNEIYKKYNNQAKNFAILNFKIDSQDLDYNLSPDKRDVIFRHEKVIFEQLRLKLQEFHDANNAKILQSLAPAKRVQTQLVFEDIKDQKKVKLSEQTQQKCVLNIQNISDDSHEKLNTSNENKQEKLLLKQYKIENQNQHTISQLTVESNKQMNQSCQQQMEIESNKNFKNHHMKLDLYKIKQPDISQSFTKIDNNKSCNVIKYNDNFNANEKQIHNINHQQQQTFIKNQDNSNEKINLNHQQQQTFIKNQDNSNEKINLNHQQQQTFIKNQDNSNEKINQNITSIIKNNVSQINQIQNLKYYSINKYNFNENNQNPNDLQICQQNEKNQICLNNYNSNEQIKYDSSNYLQNDIDQLKNISNYVTNQYKSQQSNEKINQNQVNLYDIKTNDRNKQMENCEEKCQFPLDCQSICCSKIKVKQHDKSINYEQNEKIIGQEIEQSEQMDGIVEGFKKEMFLELKWIGQFNLGFIITILNNQLYIIDQHAADEKFNFENLLKNHKIESQILIKPLIPQLNMTDKVIVCENEDIFQKNGYLLNNIDGQIHITKIPNLKNNYLTLNEFYEIIDKIKLGSDNYRPKKIYDILASKACRSSIMIGTALDEKKSTKIIQNLAQLQSPWNCPHGRPTIIKSENIGNLINQIRIHKQSEQIKFKL